MVNISVGVAALSAILGYAVVFLGIVLLMLVIFVTGSIQKNKSAEAANASKQDSSNAIIADEKELFSQFGEVSFAKDIDKNHVVAALAAISEMEKGA